MKIAKIVVITCLLGSMTGKIFAQTTPPKAEKLEGTAIAATEQPAQEGDDIDAFFAKYQAYLDSKKKPVVETKRPSTPAASQEKVNKAALDLNYYRQSTTALTKKTSPAIYSLAEQRRAKAEVGYLEAKFDLQRSMAGPATPNGASVAPKTLEDRQLEIRKAIADKAALEKKAVEEAPKADDK